MAVSALWGLVDAAFERHRTHKLVHGATSRLADVVSAMLLSARAGRDHQLAGFRRELEIDKALIAGADDVAVLSAYAAQFEDRKRHLAESAERLRGDTSLAAALLREWLLQTAKDGEGGGKDVNPITYDETRENTREAKKGATWARTEMYLAQCRYEWAKLGVDGTAALAQLEDIHRRYSQLPPNIAAHASSTYRFTQVANPTTMMIYLAERGEVPAPEVLDAKSVRPQGLLDEKGPTVISHRRAVSGGFRARRILDAVTNGQVDVSCGVEVTHGGGAVYVKGFDYRFVLVAPDLGKVYLNLKTAP